ncbi:MAG: hypothetical protein AB7K24_21810 [Gemmataceae bacterium]
MTESNNHNKEPGHELTDVSPAGILWSAGGLAVLVAVSSLAAAGLFGWLMAVSEPSQRPTSPLVHQQPRPPLPAGPPLEGIERAHREGERPDLKDAKKLNAYGWVDEKAGIVHVPIDVAVDRLVESGQLKSGPGPVPTWSDAGQIVPTGAASGRGQEGERR